MVTDGWIKLFRQTAGGRRGGVGGANSHTRRSRDHRRRILSSAAEAAEPSRLMSLPGAVLRQLARDNHEIMSQIMRIMSRELKSLEMENEHLALMSASQHVGCPRQGSRSLAPHHETRNLFTCARPAQRRGRFGQGPEVTIESFAALVYSAAAIAPRCREGAAARVRRATTNPARETLRNNRRSTNATETAALRSAAAMSARRRPGRTREGANAHRLP